ncbi:tyrosine-type recombinase/integrase (plasmid) [Streptomyces sp. QHH-9511]|uniref:tyrosine-type recombinase/integrase n=1 Tax=Streptomyces sp. QHH-9511 TaxID=2684468 RepID=UPI00131920FD|nr:tyrosine-type recombinase/integrase [Streptomyces sp. QHH-9511]QGZ53385.1 tyrosine-type recombinase/integrase [Streptomyces sp. QHH-9511]
MSDSDDLVVEGELVEEDRLPAVPQGAALVRPAVKDDPDAWLPDEVQEDIEAGIADSTNTAYQRDFAEYTAWCLTVGRRAVPAAPQTVSHYISHLTRTPRARTGRPYSPSTMERIIASIRTMHSAAGVQPPETKGARKVVAGYRRKLSEADSEQARARKTSPAVPAVLEKALSVVDRTTLKGKRDAAILLLGFACAARASELILLNVESVTEPAELEGVGVRVRIYRVKIKKWQNLTVKFGSSPETCPVRATREYLDALAAEEHTSGPLFVRIDRHGYLNPPIYRAGVQIGDPTGRLTIDAISDVVELSMAAVGMSGRWRSHSLRRGFATAALMAKADPIHTSRHGGWADGSKSFQGYVEEADGLDERNPLTNIGL